MPVEHDAQAKGLPLALNKLADAEADASAQQENNHVWGVPQSWTRGPTIFAAEAGFVLADINKAVRRPYEWHDVTAWDREGVSPYPYRGQWQVAPTGLHVWPKWSPIHLQAAAVSVLMTARYQCWDQFHVGTEGHGECTTCGLQ